jgi:hypothetical protein
LFHKFLYKFRPYFQLSQSMEDVMVFQRKKGTKVLNWGNRKYASFMISILRVLEPRRYFPEEIISRDHDEVEEMLFVSRGEVIPVPSP